IRNIEIEQTRIKSQLEKSTNPENTLLFSFITVVFSLFANLFFSSLNVKYNSVNLTFIVNMYYSSYIYIY
ncbi:hypothetical protein KWT64_14440, partial [Clostridioides difficile]|nr:hypothetical protein [Clostridioides difficile]